MFSHRCSYVDVFRRSFYIDVFSSMFFHRCFFIDAFSSMLFHRCFYWFFTDVLLLIIDFMSMFRVHVRAVFYKTSITYLVTRPHPALAHVHAQGLGILCTWLDMCCAHDYFTHVVVQEWARETSASLTKPLSWSKLSISSLPYVQVAPVVLRLVTPVEEAVLVIALVNGTPTIRVQEEQVSCNCTS